jgi:hypothetical protein
MYRTVATTFLKIKNMRFPQLLQPLFGLPGTQYATRDQSSRVMTDSLHLGKLERNTRCDARLLPYSS